MLRGSPRPHDERAANPQPPAFTKYSHNCLVYWNIEETIYTMWTTPPASASMTDAPEALWKKTALAQTPPPGETVEDDSTIRTVDDLLRRRARANPDRVIMSYPRSGVNYVDYTMRQLDVFAYRVARWYQQSIPSRQSSDAKPLTVAILGPSNLEYLITMLALSKLGHTVLFLSTRISQEAIENLMTLTGAQFLIADERFMSVARNTEVSLPSVQAMELVSRPVFEFEIEAHADTSMTHHLDLDKEASNLVFIVHSSGRCKVGLKRHKHTTRLT